MDTIYNEVILTYSIQYTENESFNPICIAFGILVRTTSLNSRKTS